MGEVYVIARSVARRGRESQAALDQHAASPHFKQLEKTVGEFLEVPFEVNILREIAIGAAAA